MKKCPDQETLSLFIDGELTGDELAGVLQHVEKCSNCQTELQRVRATESLINNRINEVFSYHRSSDKIMATVRLAAKNVSEVAEAENSFWKKFSLRLGIAVLLVFLVWVVFSPGQRFHGTVMTVSCNALNESSTINGHSLPPHQKLNLADVGIAAIDGHFLFQVTATDSSKFEAKGKAEVRLSEDNLIEFKKAHVEFNMVSGKDLILSVNDQPLQLVNKARIKTELEQVLSDKPGIASNAALPIIASSSLNIKGIVDIATATEDASVPLSQITNVNPENIAPIEQQPVVGISDDYDKNPFSEAPLGIKRD